MKTEFLKWQLWAATFFIALTIAACSRGPQVGFDRDPSVNLKNFSTFKVEAEKGVANDPVLGSELNQRRMANAVIDAMKAKGYVLDEKRPQIVVRFKMDVRDRQEIRSNYPYYRWWWFPPMYDVSTYNYQEGRLIVNIYQADTDRMIWQGWLSGEVKQARKKDSPDENAKSLVAEILRSFPESAGAIGHI
ncbi:DUF4136 domain-containing protein [Dyadobacter sp. 676]|uniref:DUF4136 domain-containing protein n=1 Tax=Dyadobacter sp. 676 TaxID=3088362 RepID=A0AAU8FJ12_9BACT